VAKPASLEDMITPRGRAVGRDPEQLVQEPTSAETVAAVQEASRGVDGNAVATQRAGQGAAPEPSYLPAPTALVPDPVSTVPMQMVQVRLPEPLVDSLRNMTYVTRKTRQDIMEMFVRRGLEEYWRGRNKE
jgi:hypothetical protein